MGNAYPWANAPPAGAGDPALGALDNPNRTFGLAMEVVARYLAQLAKNIPASMPDHVRIFVGGAEVAAQGDTAPRRSLVQQKLAEARTAWLHLRAALAGRRVTLRGAICKVAPAGGGANFEVDLRLRVNGRLALVAESCRPGWPALVAKGWLACFGKVGIGRVRNQPRASPAKFARSLCRDSPGLDENIARPPPGSGDARRPCARAGGRSRGALAGAAPVASQEELRALCRRCVQLFQP